MNDLTSYFSEPFSLLHYLTLYSKMVKYSVILPTYNERENLPLIIFLIMDMAKRKYSPAS